MTYSVVVYVRGRNFSITARMTNGARLGEVNAQEPMLGATVFPILDGLSSADAKKLKTHLTAVFRGAGLSKVPRRPL